MSLVSRGLAAFCLRSSPWRRTMGPRQRRSGFLSGAPGRRTLARRNSACGAHEDAQTVAALGMIRFAHAVENSGQNLHRYGLRAPRNTFIPILRLPVPENAKPEPLTYEKMRAIYAAFATDLAAVETILRALARWTGEAAARSQRGQARSQQ